MGRNRNMSQRSLYAKHASKLCKLDNIQGSAIKCFHIIYKKSFSHLQLITYPHSSVTSMTWMKQRCNRPISVPVSVDSKAHRSSSSFSLTLIILCQEASQCRMSWSSTVLQQWTQHLDPPWAHSTLPSNDPLPLLLYVFSSVLFNPFPNPHTRVLL